VKTIEKKSAYEW